ncbi:MAG TPA: rod shape-determining protein MreC [Burkholderiales bacterium]|nr:rod shape-determining protein MreC [Burkholderiales bacterium]
MDQDLFSRGPSPAVRLTFFTLVSLLLLVSDAHYNYLKTMRQGIATAIYPLQRIAMAPVEFFASAGSYAHSQSMLVKENAALKKQNLEDQAALLRYRALQQENMHLRKLFDARERTEKPAIMAEILSDERDPFSRKVIVGKGLQAHVAIGSAVIDDKGVIGQVLAVYPFSSEVSLITDKGHPTPVQVLRNGLRAVVFGFGSSDLLDLRYMSTNVDIRPGDLLVTSGLDGIFPAGIPVAKVVKVDRNPAYAFSRILCQPVGGVNQFGQVLILSSNSSAKGKK